MAPKEKKPKYNKSHSTKGLIHVAGVLGVHSIFNVSFYSLDERIGGNLSTIFQIALKNSSLYTIPREGYIDGRKIGLSNSTLLCSITASFYELAFAIFNGCMI